MDDPTTPDWLRRALNPPPKTEKKAPIKSKKGRPRGARTSVKSTRQDSYVMVDNKSRDGALDRVCAAVESGLIKTKADLDREVRSIKTRAGLESPQTVHSDMIKQYLAAPWAPGRSNAPWHVSEAGAQSPGWRLQVEHIREWIRLRSEYQIRELKRAQQAALQAEYEREMVETMARDAEK